MAKRNELEFSSKEFPHHEKNSLWYIGIGLMVVAAIVITVKYRNYLLAAVALAAGLAIFRLAHEKPSTHEIRLTPKGVYWGKDFIPYYKLKSYWIDRAGDHITVYLERLNFASLVTFMIPKNKAADVAVYLSNFLPFHDHKSEPVTDKLNRFLRI